jgi:hypothetical protein
MTTLAPWLPSLPTLICLEVQNTLSLIDRVVGNSLGPGRVEISVTYSLSSHFYLMTPHPITLTSATRLAVKSSWPEPWMGTS